MSFLVHTAHNPTWNGWTLHWRKNPVLMWTALELWICFHGRSRSSPVLSGIWVQGQGVPLLTQVLGVGGSGPVPGGWLWCGLDPDLQSAAHAADLSIFSSFVQFACFSEPGWESWSHVMLFQCLLGHRAQTMVGFEGTHAWEVPSRVLRCSG